MSEECDSDDKSDDPIHTMGDYFNASTFQPTSELASQPMSQPASQPSFQPVSQQTSQQMHQVQFQPTSKQFTNRSIIHSTIPFLSYLSKSPSWRQRHQLQEEGHGEGLQVILEDVLREEGGVEVEGELLRVVEPQPIKEKTRQKYGLFNQLTVKKL